MVWTTSTTAAGKSRARKAFRKTSTFYDMVFKNKKHLNHHNKNSYVNTFNEVNNDGDRNRNRSIRDRNRRCSSLYIKKPTNLDSKYLGALLQERCPSYDSAVQYQRGQMRLEILARNDLNVQLLSVEGQNTGVLNAANKVEFRTAFGRTHHTVFVLYRPSEGARRKR